VNKSLLDTDILSEIHKARDRGLVERAEQCRQEFGSYSLASVTVLEVVRGLRMAGKTEKLTAFLTGLAGEEVLACTRSTAELAGLIDADFQSAGQTIGRIDPIIAATAIEHDLVLVTGNTDHFARVQSLGYALPLENWRGLSTAGDWQSGRRLTWKT
jgi:tRNA(fMet)-specific endonuclease VapC